MATTSERLAAIREKLQDAREANVKAVENETYTVHKTQAKRPRSDSESSQENTLNRRRQRKLVKAHKLSQADIDVGSADEADGENTDDRLRSMKRRARFLKKKPEQRQVTEVERTNDDGVVTYGGDRCEDEDVDRMVGELQHAEKRRAKFRRRRAFDEDKTDITFINEGNRLFNRSLERHFDKFESVQKLKENLERGTA